jgi:hypothetical protein
MKIHQFPEATPEINYHTSKVVRKYSFAGYNSIWARADTAVHIYCRIVVCLYRSG